MATIHLLFFVRDSYRFPDFIHTQKPIAMWDFWSLSPESLHRVTILVGDRGLPQSPRFMNGYGSHTDSFINAKQERFWVKFHFKTQQGIKFHTSPEVEAIVAKTRESFQENLFGSIEKDDFPNGKLFVQVTAEPDVDKHGCNPFGLTKVWPQGDRLPIEVGMMELNHNPPTSRTRLTGLTQKKRFVEPPLNISENAARYDHRHRNGDYRQPGDLFCLMSEDAQQRLFGTIAEAMQGVPLEIVKRQIRPFCKADPQNGAGVD